MYTHTLSFHRKQCLKKGLKNADTTDEEQEQTTTTTRSCGTGVDKREKDSRMAIMDPKNSTKKMLCGTLTAFCPI